MSVRAEGTPLSPIPQSSAPRCPCGNEQPCLCERFAHRLERRWQQMMLAQLEVERRLHIAQEALERIRLSADQQIALGAVRRALELL